MTLLTSRFSDAQNPKPRAAESDAQRPVFSSSFAIQRRVVSALILRDMKTRFGRTHVAYLIAIAWPLIHMLGIMGVQFAIGRVVPIGTDLAVFAATGLLPYILCIYPARMMMQAIKVNQPLLLFSIVKTTDMLIARAILEVLSAALVAIIFVLIMYASDVDLTPIDTSEAIMAVLASIYLGVSVGVLSAVFFILFGMGWNVFFIVLSILLYATSGALILSSNYSAEVLDVLWYNPLFQLVEWMRTAYYDSYANSPLSKTYVLGFATVSLFLGLVTERIFRGRLYQA